MLRNGERIAIKGRSYRLDGVLSNGAGSYGQVWAATDPAGRAVAIKLINAEAMTQADPALHDHWRKHLEREINFLRGLDADRSRHVVALLDDGVVDGQPALVLERLQANLGQWLANQRREGTPPPDLAQILDWAEQVLDGLDVVHQAGFVYRDLKLSNLLVGNDGARIKLADFGSLKREDGDNTRSFIGTPATMAPEQVLPARQGRKVTNTPWTTAPITTRWDCCCSLCSPTSPPLPPSAGLANCWRCTARKGQGSGARDWAAWTTRSGNCCGAPSSFGPCRRGPNRAAGRPRCWSN